MIGETTNGVLPSATVKQASQNAASTAAISSDFETFLKMLTAQAKYQDPLEPIDSTEYAAQLAQFSMVEQQVKTNDSLSDLMTQLGSQNAASLSAWVGKEVRANTPAKFDGTPITISPKPAPGADKTFLIVTDADGSPLERRLIPVATDPIQWNGLDSSGTPFASGTYKFAVESQSDGEVLTTLPAEIYVQVAEAQIEGGDVVLLLDGGQSVSAQAGTALRNPS